MTRQSQRSWRFPIKLTMPFQFSLRALLRLRQTYEKRERMRLALLNAAYSRLEQEYEEARRQKRLGVEQLGNRLRDGIFGSELRAAAAAVQQSADRQLQLREQMEAVKLQARKQTELFLEAQKERKILDSLRERELRAYELDENRREQQGIDDLFVQRRRFQPDG